MRTNPGRKGQHGGVGEIRYAPKVGRADRDGRVNDHDDRQDRYEAEESILLPVDAATATKTKVSNRVILSSRSIIASERSDQSRMSIREMVEGRIAIRGTKGATHKYENACERVIPQRKQLKIDPRICERAAVSRALFPAKDAFRRKDAIPLRHSPAAFDAVALHQHSSTHSCGAPASLPSHAAASASTHFSKRKRPNLRILLRCP